MTTRLPIALPQRDLTSDDWYTPPELFAAMPGVRFDLDPAAPPGGLPWIPAARFLSEADNGLDTEWAGFVWLNPPYSQPAPWIRRLADHGNGLALVAGDPTTSWWEESIAEQASAVCWLRHRVRFVRPGLDRWERTSARFPSALVAYGTAALEVVASSHLGWTVVPLRKEPAR